LRGYDHAVSEIARSGKFQLPGSNKTWNSPEQIPSPFPGQSAGEAHRSEKERLAAALSDALAAKTGRQWTLPETLEAIDQISAAAAKAPGQARRLAAAVTDFQANHATRPDGSVGGFRPTGAAAVTTVADREAAASLVEHLAQSARRRQELMDAARQIEAARRHAPRVMEWLSDNKERFVEEGTYDTYLDRVEALHVTTPTADQAAAALSVVDEFRVDKIRGRLKATAAKSADLGNGAPPEVRGAIDRITSIDPVKVTSSQVAEIHKACDAVWNYAEQTNRTQKVNKRLLDSQRTLARLERALATPEAATVEYDEIRAAIRTVKGHMGSGLTADEATGVNEALDIVWAYAKEWSGRS
jgi:hypothetical protein